LHLSNKKINLEENEEPVLLEANKPKNVEKKEANEDGEEEEKEEAPKEEEGEEAKAKFKPEGFSWTEYDGNPRNHVQVISRFTKYPIKECDTSIRNLESILLEILNGDIKTKEGKIHLINY
jgi:hypothetical protein